MDNLTVVIPYYNGHDYLKGLLDSIPIDIPVIVVDDKSDKPLHPLDSYRIGGDTKTIWLDKKGYFTGAVNAGISSCETDVLVLNQDVELQGTQWLEILKKYRNEYALIGEKIKGDHPAFPNGYPHGVFMFMRRDAIDKVGLMDEENYPLWGSTALWQWQICRAGFKSLPLGSIPGLVHHRENRPTGSSITQLLKEEPTRRDLFIRTPPEVSMVIPCYNHGRYLERTINSLIGGQTDLGLFPHQTFKSFEIIIVDDGSTDETPEVAQSFADGWRGIRYIRQENQGTASAHNTGIRAALGKYITCMSADDLREPWALEKLYKAVKENPHHFVYDPLEKFWNGQRRGSFPEHGLEPYDFDTMRYKNMVPVGKMYPKQAWEEVGGYPEVLKHGREDWGFALALGRMGWCGIKLEEPGYLYRWEGQNRVRRNSDVEWKEFFYIQMQKLFPDIYRGEYPVACCGKGGSSVQKANQIMASINLAGQEGMVILEYIGRSVGSSRWGGRDTNGRVYTFGNNVRDKRKYVDSRDKQWFLSKTQHGQPLFREYVVTPPELSPDPTVELNGDNTPSITVETVDEEPTDTVEEVEKTIAPFITQEQLDSLIVPKVLTLDGIDEHLDEVYQMELAGKGRTTLLAGLKEKAVELQVELA